MDTIQTFSKDVKHLGANTGMISILHTWGQQLTLHPHLHCIIPSGGLTKEGKWKFCKTKGHYLFPVKALSNVYRAKYMHHLRKRIAQYNTNAKQHIMLPQQLTNECFKKQWVVYAKRPFSGVKSVVEYLGRYTHKIAISNHRIVDINTTNNTVTISYKDYKDNGIKKQLTLSAMEFVRRFSVHILPKAFVRIRHYGILSSTSKVKAIKLIRNQIHVKQITKTQTCAKAYNPLKCPCCKKETMVQLLHFNRRGPPHQWRKIAREQLILKSI